MLIFATILSVIATALSSAALLLGLRVFRRANLFRIEITALQKENQELEHILILRQQEFGTSLAKLMIQDEAIASALQLKHPSSRSQHGDEIWIWEYLGRPMSGFYIEVGAHDGETFSNSFFLEKIGWDGLLVEANEALFTKCSNARPKARVFHAALTSDPDITSVTFTVAEGSPGVDLLSFSTTDARHRDRIESEGGKMREVSVPAATLDQLLEKCGAKHVDFASIDVEGAELEVIKGMDFERWKPRVLLIEDNSGGQNEQVRLFMAERGYKIIKRLGCNDVYAPTTASN